MKTTKLFSIGLTAIMIFAFSQQTFAQLADFYTSSGYINTINTAMSNSVMGNYKKKNKDGSGASKSKSSRQPEPNLVPDYRKYPAVQFKSTGTRLTLPEYLDSVKVSPQDKAELKQLVLALFDLYETEAAAKGYPNDWALALVSYIGLNSRVYNGITEKPNISFEQNIGLRDVVAEAATDNGIFKNVTDREKQELYELLVIGGGLTYYFYKKALQEKNTEELKDLKIQAAQNLKIVGIKP